MKIRIVLLAVVLALAGCAPVTVSAPPRAPSLIFITAAPAASDPFIASAIESARKVAAELGATLEVLESADDESVNPQVAAALRAHPDVIIGLGNGVLDELDPAAASNLDQQFLIVDGQADEPTENLTAAVFRTQESLYLTGAEAGLIATDGRVGIVVPADDPLDRAWAQPFVDGAMLANPRARVRVAAAGSAEPDASALSMRDRAGAARVARHLSAQGSDVLHSVRFAVPPSLDFGIDASSCESDPGTLLDTTIRRVDVALRASLRAIADGRTGGVQSYGLAEDGVGLVAIDAGPASGCLVADRPEVLAKVKAIRDRIIAGDIRISDPEFAG